MHQFTDKMIVLRNPDGLLLILEHDYRRRLEHAVSSKFSPKESSHRGFLLVRQVKSNGQVPAPLLHLGDLKIVTSVPGLNPT